MHYYKRNLGDYAKKAGRLTMLQHGAYTLLIDACYDREQFPTLEEAIDWAWASSSAEVEAVEFVLRKFFTLVDGRYVQNRIQEEIEAYRAVSETNARIARERETKRAEKSTKRERTVNDASRSGNEAPPNQEPLTINQEPLTTSNDVVAPRKRGGKVSKKCPDDFVLTDELLQWAAENAPLVSVQAETDSFRDYTFKTSKSDWPATWRSWMRKANEFAAQRTTSTAVQPIRETFRERDTRLARERMEEAIGRRIPDHKTIDITPLPAVLELTR